MISVIIPTYNKSHLLAQTINVVLNQTLQDLEIIVIDDASTDQTSSLMKSLENDKIHYIKNNSQRGTTQARILGIKQAQGEFVAFLDDDDWWNPSTLDKLLHCYANNKKIDFVMCNYMVNNLIDKTGYVVNLEKYYTDFQTNISIKPGPFLQCCLFRKDFILNNICLFDVNSEPSEDWDFFLNLAKLNPGIGYVNATLFKWNFSKQSQSYNYANEWAAIEYIITKNKKIFLDYNSKYNLSLQYRRLGYYMFKLNKIDKFKYYYSLAYATYPLSITNIMYKLLLCLPLKIQVLIINNK